LAQEQPQRPTTSSSDAHAIHGPFQKVTPEELGRRTSPQLTYERIPSPIGLASLPTGVDGKTRHVPKKVKSAAPDASSEGEIAQFEHGRIVELEQQLELAMANANAMKAVKCAELELRKQADQVLVQTSRVNQKDAELVRLQAKLDELLLSRTQDARTLDQAQSALQKATSRAVEADERSRRAYEQVEQCGKELAAVRTELEVKKSELEDVRLRLPDSENGWTKSKAEAETFLHATTAKSPDNIEESQITRRLMERMQAMEAEIASLRWNEKSFEMMECRNEG
jgi:hypothetical protein